MNNYLCHTVKIKIVLMTILCFSLLCNLGQGNIVTAQLKTEFKSVDELMDYLVEIEWDQMAVCVKKLNIEKLVDNQLKGEGIRYLMIPAFVATPPGIIPGLVDKVRSDAASLAKSIVCTNLEVNVTDAEKKWSYQALTFAEEFNLIMRFKAEEKGFQKRYLSLAQTQKHYVIDDMLWKKFDLKTKLRLRHQIEITMDLQVRPNRGAKKRGSKKGGSSK